MSSTGAAPLKTTYAVGIGIGISLAVVTAASLWYFRRKCHENAPPTKWRRIGIIEKINIFPVKSCGALKLNDDDEISCDTIGLSMKGCRDRSLMLINEKGNVISARNFPRMGLIESEFVEPSHIKFTAPENMGLVLNLVALQSKESAKIRALVGKTKIKVYLCGQKYDKWFSKVVLRQGSGLRLVYYHMKGPIKSINSRMLKEPHITNDDREVNAMLINLATVDELYRYIDRNETFRGSFELTMDEHEPYAEDCWDWIRIGDDAIFNKVAPCTRRIYPQVDMSNETPETLLQCSLKRLRSFEGYPNPIFGMHLSICQPGTIKVNDVVYVKDYLKSLKGI